MAQSWKRPPRGPVEAVLAKLYEAISVPNRMNMIFAQISFYLNQIGNPQMRRELEDFREDIEDARDDRMELDRISQRLERWQDTNFPTS
ncbi:MAG: hypothetical protein QNK37_36285 [Acidobacteriota bacterium]|nr:hypothetical protein [Acidobacteriota bacterium]